VTTAGRYIFCDDDTPVTPVPTNLWSRDWISDELDDAVLGEDPSAVRTYSLGGAIGPIPPPTLLGTADCLANGETWPLPMVPTLIGGFPSDCFLSAPEPPAPLDVTDPSNWCFWAETLNEAYSDPVGARAKVATALAVPATGYVQAQVVSLTPTWFILTSAPSKPLVLAITGTSTPLQWITQVFYGARPPTDFGTFATNTIWYLLASDILERMRLIGASATQDIVIVGHSLGGAVAALIAARLRLASPTRSIQLLTLGSPRQGDLRLNTVIRTTEVVNIQNDGDFVPQLPYNLADFPISLIATVAAFYPAGSKLWAEQLNRQRVEWDGTVLAGAAQPGRADVLDELLVWALLGGPYPDFGPHLQGEYERRICSAVALPIVWLDAFDLSQANAASVPVWANRVNALNSPQALPGFGVPFYNWSAQRLPRSVVFLGNDVLALPTAVGGAGSWSFYAVAELVFPTGSFPSSFRWGVPLAGSNVSPESMAQWGGTGSSSPGWKVFAKGVSQDIPWEGDDNVPTLLKVSYNEGALTLYLEDVTGTTAVATGLASNPFWQFVGGFPSLAPPLPIAGLLLAELLLFGSALSAADDASVLNYLRLRWLARGAGITTEGGDLLTTEGGDVLITE